MLTDDDFRPYLDYACQVWVALDDGRDLDVPRTLRTLSEMIEQCYAQRGQQEDYVSMAKTALIELELRRLRDRLRDQRFHGRLSRWLHGHLTQAN